MPSVEETKGELSVPIVVRPDVINQTVFDPKNEIESAYPVHKATAIKKNITATTLLRVCK